MKFIQNKNQNKKLHNGFSFLELIIVSFLFTMGILGVFPVIKNIRTNQQDIFLRFKALKIAENEIAVPQSLNSEKSVVYGREKYIVKKNVSKNDKLNSVVIKVEYSSGLISGEVSLATEFYA